MTIEWLRPTPVYPSLILSVGGWSSEAVQNGAVGQRSHWAAKTLHPPESFCSLTLLGLWQNNSPRDGRTDRTMERFRWQQDECLKTEICGDALEKRDLSAKNSSEEEAGMPKVFIQQSKESLFDSGAQRTASSSSQGRKYTGIWVSKSMDAHV